MNVAQQPAVAVVPITVVSDAAGKFEFTNVDPGAYQMLARRDGFANVQLGIKNGSKTTDPILLGKGDRKTEFKVKMTPHGVIAGAVMEPDGDPIRNMPVAAMVYRYTTRGRELVETQSTSTNDLGEYRLFDLPPGKYFIRASPRPMRAGAGPEDSEFYGAGYYPGAPDSAGASVVELAAGQQLSGFNVLLRKTRYATIRGKVVAPPGATNISAGRMIVSDGGTSTNTTSVDDKDGKFQFFGIAPGSIYLVGFYNIGGVRHTAQVALHVGSSDIENVELRPMPPADVVGRVRIEGNTVAKPPQVQIGLQGPGRGANADLSWNKDEGALTFRDVDLNVYRVNLNRMGTFYLKSLHWGTTDITDSELDLTSGVPARTELTIVLGGDSGEIEGAVKNEKGEPVDSAAVTLAPTGSHRTRPFHKNVTTDATGHFRIQGVAPGPYKIFAWDTVDVNAVIFDPDFLRPHESAGQNVQLSANEKKSVDLKVILNDQK